MSKNKNKKQKVFRGHRLPKDYLEAVSDRIFSTSPSLEIINNTLEGVYSIAYTKGYKRRIDEASNFKQWKEMKRKEDFDRFKDWLDDLIHQKSNIEK